MYVTVPMSFGRICTDVAFSRLENVSGGFCVEVYFGWCPQLQLGFTALDPLVGGEGGVALDDFGCHPKLELGGGTKFGFGFDDLVGSGAILKRPYVGVSQPVFFFLRLNIWVLLSTIMQNI
jgi:hypothetical protein